MKRALISGAAGFVGSHLVDRLIKENYFVLGVDNLITGNIKNLDLAKKSNSFEFINLDVSKELPKFNGEFELIHFYFSVKDSNKKTICIEKEVGSKYQSKINKLELVIHGTNAFEGKVKVGNKTYSIEQFRKGDLLIIPVVFSKSNIKIEWIPWKFVCVILTFIKIKIYLH